MKSALTFFISCLFALSLSAQLQQTIMFEKTWGDNQRAEKVILYADELPNGNFDLIGWRMGSSNAAERSRFYMCQLDKNGEIIWEKLLGDDWVAYVPGSIIKTRSGHYLIVGSSGVVAGSSNICLFEIDPQGNTVFAQNYSAGSHDAGRSVCETNDTCFMLAVGLSYGSNSSPGLIKVDRWGNELWRNKQDSLPNLRHAFIRPLPTGEFIVTGSSPVPRCYIAKYAANGDLMWFKYPFGTDSLASTPQGLFVEPDGSLSVPTARGGDTYWRDFDANGIMTHEKVYGTTLAFCWLNSVNYPSTDISDSSYVATMSSTSTSANCVFKIDASRDLKFQARLTTDSLNKFLWYSIRTSDGGYLSVGEHRLDQDSAAIFYAVKFSGDGRYQPDDFLGSVDAYPNPSPDGNITLSFDMTTDETVHVKVLAADGRLVYTDELFCPANSHTELPVRLNEGTTAGGMYVMEATTSSAFYRKKLIVMRSR